MLASSIIWTICRYVPMFGDLDYDPAMVYAAASFEEQLEALGRAVEAGKVGWLLLVEGALVRCSLLA